MVPFPSSYLYFYNISKSKKYPAIWHMRVLRTVIDMGNVDLGCGDADVDAKKY